MTVIAKSKTTFDIAQYENVTNLAYDAATQIYTITYGNAQTVTFGATGWLIAIMFK